MQRWNPNKRVVSTGSFFAICNVILIVLFISYTMQLTSWDVLIDCRIFAITEILHFQVILGA